MAMNDLPRDEPLTIWTIGHSTRPVAELVELLRQAEVTLLVDIRAVPPPALAAAGIAYRHLPALGGLRGRQKGVRSSNLLWRSEAFRNYADYAASSTDFRAGLRELIDLAADRRSAIMCAEAVWWRCHRRIVSDYLIVSGLSVRHILGRGQIE